MSNFRCDEAYITLLYSIVMYIKINTNFKEKFKSIILDKKYFKIYKIPINYLNVQKNQIYL